MTGMKHERAILSTRHLRFLVQSACLGLAFWVVATPAFAGSFGFAQVEDKARALQEAPYQAQALPVPASLQKLTPEQY
ncbi:MAG: hypothetical protein B7Z70_12840, partial [Acidithiobacillus ferrivorans]